jgi:hypothetical protein
MYSLQQRVSKRNKRYVVFVLLILVGGRIYVEPLVGTVVCKSTVHPLDHTQREGICLIEYQAMPSLLDRNS